MCAQKQSSGRPEDICTVLACCHDVGGTPQRSQCVICFFAMCWRTRPLNCISDRRTLSSITRTNPRPIRPTGLQFTERENKATLRIHSYSRESVQIAIDKRRQSGLSRNNEPHICRATQTRSGWLCKMHACQLYEFRLEGTFYSTHQQVLNAELLNAG
jgi:hypothetical protein